MRIICINFLINAIVVIISYYFAKQSPNNQFDIFTGWLFINCTVVIAISGLFWFLKDKNFI